MQETIFYVFIYSGIIQITYYLCVFGRLALFKETINSKKDNETPDFPVSVVICARNEAENLHRHLPSILNQDYPVFEVLVVDDGSTDNTKEVLAELKKQHERLKILFIDETQKKLPGKKTALSKGIHASSHEHLLLTDADCKPLGKHWIRNMSAHLKGKKEIVLGYGGYYKKNGWLNKLIRFDTFFVALQYFSFALLGKPYMGVGRNLAYKKDIFLKNNGFNSHTELISGDDDLFINEVSTAGNVMIEIKKESHTLSAPENKFTGWLSQKRRHFTTAVRYKLIHKVLLGLHYLSQLLFFYALTFLIAYGNTPAVVFLMLISRLILQLYIFKKCMAKLEESDLLLFSPLIEIIFVVIYPLIYLSNLKVINHERRF